jgi:hypothetical protein
LNRILTHRFNTLRKCKNSGDYASQIPRSAGHESADYLIEAVTLPPQAKRALTRGFWGFYGKQQHRAARDACEQRYPARQRKMHRDFEVTLTGKIRE